MDPEIETKEEGWGRENHSMKRHQTANFKAQVVQELCKEDKSMAQIAAEEEVHPTPLRRWKAVVVEGLPSLCEEKELSVRIQVELVSAKRSGVSSQPHPPEPAEVRLNHRIDEIYTPWPFDGSRKMTAQ